MFNDAHGLLAVHAYRLSLRAALQNKKRQAIITEAIDAEIENIESNAVMSVINFKAIPMSQRHGIISAHMFLKEKFKADGSYDKMKAKLVANGDQVLSEHLGVMSIQLVSLLS